MEQDHEDLDVLVSDHADQEDNGLEQDDMLYIPEDKFPLPPKRARQLMIKDNVEDKPFYYSQQECLAEKVVQRIEVILQQYYEKSLEDFTEFDFQIYTAKSNMLQGQTVQRLASRLSGCFFNVGAENSDPKELLKMACERVHKYDMTDAGVRARMEKIQQEAKNSPQKLFLIVGDEAHWGIGKSAAQATTGDHSTTYKLPGSTLASTDAPSASLPSTGVLDTALPNTHTCTLRPCQASKPAPSQSLGNISKAGANDCLINGYSDKEHPNVFVIQVSATPYNLKTSSSRYYPDIVAVCENRSTATGESHVNEQPSHSVSVEEDQSSACINYLVIVEKIRGRYQNKISGEDVTDRCLSTKDLHFISWGESFADKLEQGIVVKLKVPRKNKHDAGTMFEDKFDWLVIGEATDPDSVWPLSGTEDEEKAIELIFTGSNKVIEIETVDHSLQLVVIKRKDKLSCELGFVQKQDLLHVKDCEKKFHIVLEFGEDVLELHSCMQGIKSSYMMYEEKGRMVKLANPPGDRGGMAGLPVHSMEYSFITESCRQEEQMETDPTLYLSLNYCFNSMRNQEKGQQRIRNDDEFADMIRESKKKKKKKGGRSRTNPEENIQATADDPVASAEDMLAAQYSFFIILIKELREATITARSLDSVLEDPTTALGNYSERRDQRMVAFKEQLRNFSSSQTFHAISLVVFDKVIKFYEDTAWSQFDKYVKAEIGRKDWIADNLFNKCLVGCLLFADDKVKLKEEFHTVQQRLGEANKLNECRRCFWDLKEEFQELKESYCTESETYGIVNDLIKKEIPEKGLEGQMKVIRLTSKDCANTFYTTLCLARMVGQGEQDYFFEVLRDYGNFRISDMEKEEETAVENNLASLHRIRQVLQTEKCTHTERDGVDKCICESYRPNGSLLECIICGHRHKKVAVYQDLNRLPCILILVLKGRMGDTFPESFNTLDLRLCYQTRKPPLLSTLQQELGRLCRYTARDKNSISKLPYALIGGSLWERLEVYLRNYATLAGGFVCDGFVDTHAKKPKLSGGISVAMEASDSSYDHKNLIKHRNRLLLEAEPQCGKTGVYLNVIKRLRERISPEKVSDEEELYFSDDGSEEESDEAEEPLPSTDVQEGDKAEKWLFPYWKEMENGAKLQTKTRGAKYAKTFGDYCYESDMAPPRLMQAGSRAPTKKLTKKSKSSDANKGPSPDRFRAYNAIEHRCKLCSCEAKALCTKCDFGDHGEVKISIPLLQRFAAAIETLNVAVTGASQLNTEASMPWTSSQSEMEASGTVHDRPTLKTWIFHPTYNRPEKACVNYRHTMVAESSGRRCDYVQVLLVREEEYSAYCKIWQSTHIILQLPPYMKDCEVNASEGGIGYARLFIQRFSAFYVMQHVIMIDDNVSALKQVTCHDHNGEEYIQRDNGSLVVRPAPLFSLLKRMESLCLDEATELPMTELEPYPDPELDSKLHKFTGPASRYAVLGTLKDRLGIRRVKRPFTRTHVMSLVFLNVRALKTADIEYKPWQCWEDLRLNNECDEKDLWVCKFNRYIMVKRYMKTWLPQVFTWLNDVEDAVPKKLQSKKKELSLEEESTILLRYIQRAAPPSRVDMILGEVEPATPLPDLTQLIVKLKSTRGGTHHFLAYRGRASMPTPTSDTVTRDLQQYLTTTLGIGGFCRHILLLPWKLCQAAQLGTYADVKKMLLTVFEEESKIQLVTSHNKEEYHTQLVLVHVEGKIMNAADDEAKPNVAEPMPKHRSKPHRARATEDQPTSVKSSRSQFPVEDSALRKQLITVPRESEGHSVDGGEMHQGHLVHNGAEENGGRVPKRQFLDSDDGGPPAKVMSPGDKGPGQGQNSEGQGQRQSSDTESEGHTQDSGSETNRRSDTNMNETVSPADVSLTIKDEEGFDQQYSDGTESDDDRSLLSPLKKNATATSLAMEDSGATSATAAAVEKDLAPPEADFSDGTASGSQTRLNEYAGRPDGQLEGVGGDDDDQESTASSTSLLLATVDNPDHDLNENAVNSFSMEIDAADAREHIGGIANFLPTSTLDRKKNDDIPSDDTPRLDTGLGPRGSDNLPPANDMSPVTPYKNENDQDMLFEQRDQIVATFEFRNPAAQGTIASCKIDNAPGRYRGRILVNAGGRTLGKVPSEISRLYRIIVERNIQVSLKAEVIEEYWKPGHQQSAAACVYKIYGRRADRDEVRQIMHRNSTMQRKASEPRMTPTQVEQTGTRRSLQFQDGSTTPGTVVPTQSNLPVPREDIPNTGINAQPNSQGHEANTEHQVAAHPAEPSQQQHHPYTKDYEIYNTRTKKTRPVQYGMTLSLREQLQRKRSSNDIWMDKDHTAKVMKIFRITKK